MKRFAGMDFPAGVARDSFTAPMDAILAAIDFSETPSGVSDAAFAGASWRET